MAAVAGSDSRLKLYASKSTRGTVIAMEVAHQDEVNNVVQRGLKAGSPACPQNCLLRDLSTLQRSGREKIDRHNV